MFSKTEKDTPSMTPVAAPEKTGKSNVPSIISTNLTITGNIKTDGDVQVDGTIDGDLQSKQLTLGESGVVNGAIVADLARISGTVNGSITARVVELGRTAKITGDINHFSLAIEPGAYIQGQLTHVDEQKIKAPAGNGADIKPTSNVLAAESEKKTAEAGKGLPN
jgi:cytoskeletal protein CcmA (bactofilin family)